MKRQKKFGWPNRITDDYDDSFAVIDGDSFATLQRLEFSRVQNFFVLLLAIFKLNTHIH